MSDLESRLSAPRIVRHSDDLLRAIRDRIEQLNTTHASIEAVAGLQSNYLTKVVASPPPKRMSLWTAFLVLEAIGLQVSLSVAPDFAERFGHRLERRKLVRAKARIRRKARKPPPPDFLQHRSRLGGFARKQKLAAERLSEIGRAAVNTRWSRHREQQSAAPATLSGHGS